MPLVKVKPTSAGRRGYVKVVTPELHKGRPHEALLDRKSRTAGRNNYGHITTRHHGGGHKRHYRIIDFKRRKDGIPALVERIEYDPNRSAHLALLLYADGERRYIIAPKGVERRRAARERRRRVDQGRQRQGAAEHPGRHDDPLHRAAARQGRAARAVGGRVGAAARARRAATRRCGCARARSAR